jgi:hypothetical protein
MNITISPIPGTSGYDVWIGSTKLYMTYAELVRLHQIIGGLK